MKDLCKRCGKCCFEYLGYEGKWHRRKPCEYLRFDNGKATCIIYESRFVNPKCNPIDGHVVNGIVPDTCGYAPEGYKSKAVD